MGIVAGIVTKNDFVMPNKKSKSGKVVDFSGYVDYTSRKEAMKQHKKELLQKVNEGEYIDSYQEYEEYVDGYMNNQYKTKGGGLFNADYDHLQPEQYKELKEQFKKAQKNGSPLWQDVVSFDNRWLEKHGFYQSETHTVKEDVLRNAIRTGVNAMLKKEKLSDSTVWYASIHYNTDNIHVHIASAEPIPSAARWMDSKKAYRGFRKPKSTEQLKSKIANYLLDRGEEQSKINDLIRNNIVKEKKNVSLSSVRQTKLLFLQAISKLPKDRKQWFYNYHTIDEARPYIDEISKIYLETFHKKEMLELDKRLDQEVEIMKETYGQGSKFERYKEEKKKDLYTRMGNAVLQEMRSYARTVGKKKKGGGSRRTQNTTYYNRWQQQGELDRAVRQLHYRLKDNYNDHKKQRNIDEFDRMLEGRE